MSEPQDTLIAEISELREALARHCACTHDGRGELTNECEEHRSLEDERDQISMMANALAKQLQIEAEARGKAEAQVRELRAQLDAVKVLIESHRREASYFANTYYNEAIDDMLTKLRPVKDRTS